MATTGYAHIDAATNKIVVNEINGQVPSSLPISVAEGGTSATTVEGARSILGTPGVLSTINNINGKVTGQTNLYTVPLGKTAVVTSLTIRLIVATGLTGTLRCSVGANLTADDVFTNTNTTGFRSASQHWIFSSAGAVTAVSPAQIIKFAIANAFGGTTATLAVDLLGYLV